jgi:hypothetical protein
MEFLRRALAVFGLGGEVEVAEPSGEAGERGQATTRADARDIALTREALDAFGWRVESGLKYASDFVIYKRDEVRERGGGRRGHSVACVNVINDADWPSDATTPLTAPAQVTWGSLMLRLRLSSTVVKRLQFVHAGSEKAVGGRPGTLQVLSFSMLTT